VLCDARGMTTLLQWQLACSAYARFSAAPNAVMGAHWLADAYGGLKATDLFGAKAEAVLEDSS
jgi:hypothetical protein